MNIIEINNLHFEYKEKVIFDKFNLKIRDNKWTTIVGSNGSGKSTLAKIIIGLLKQNDGIIKINNIVLNDISIKQIRNQIGMIFSNPDNQFIAETVEDNIAFALENIQMSSTLIKEKVMFVAKLLNIENILTSSPYDLSGGEKQLVILASTLV